MDEVTTDAAHEGAAVPAQGRSVVRGDADWLDALRSVGPAREAAGTDLYDLLHRAARAEVRRRAPRVGLAAGDVDDLARQAAADATVAVLAKLDAFRGESRFTTWAYAFAVFEVSAAVAQHVRATRAVRLDVADWEALPDRWAAGPVDEVQGRELLTLLRRTVEEQLTPRQRRVFVAIAVDGVPLDVVAAELGANRNAIYKTMFEARRKIRDVLAAHGYIGAPADAPADGRAS